MEQILNLIKSRLERPSTAFSRLNATVAELGIDEIRTFLTDQTMDRWNRIKVLKIGRYTIEELLELKNGTAEMPDTETFKDILQFSLSNIQIISVESEGRTFEAYVKLIMLDPDGITIRGLSLGGNLTSCRAIHASIYNNREVYVTDLLNGTVKEYRSNFHYRRIEEVQGKVCHTFLLPRNAIVQEYNYECMNADVSNRAHPDRILISRGDDITEVAGQFLAQKYSLPRTSDWANLYLSLLPADKWCELELIKTDMVGESGNLRAIIIRSMQESEVLEVINAAIIKGDLNVFSEIGEAAVLTEGMTTEDYLRVNAEIITKKIDTYLKPLYDGHTYAQFLGMTNRVCLPAQARSVMGVLTVLKFLNSCFLVGDMGSGKTQMSLSAIFAILRRRMESGAPDGISVLITAPAITIPKWATSEIPKILGSQKIITTIINSTEDALRYVAKVKGYNPNTSERTPYKVPKGYIHFVLVSTDRMKLAANKFVLAAHWDHIKQVWRCPDCHQPLRCPKAKANESDLLATWSDGVESPIYPPSKEQMKTARKSKLIDVNNLPRNFVKRYTDHIRSFECSCHLKKTKKNKLKEKSKDEKVERKRHATLVRPALKSRGEDRNKPRWMIAEIFQRHLRNHFQVGIFDEIQQMKASDSGRGMSFHKIMWSCRKSLFLTGTLTNGTSSSIQSTLWRSDPQPLIDEGFNHKTSKEQWAKKYGVLESITYMDDKAAGVLGRSSNRVTERVIIKEKAGIAPQLVARHLLHKSIFLELADLNIPLVQLKEEPVIVPLDPEHQDAYRKFHDELEAVCKDLQPILKSKAWSQFNPATLNYASQPQREVEVNFYDDEGDLLRSVKAPKFPAEYLTATERRLIEDVKADLSENRGSIIFTHYTGIYGTNQRIQRILANEGVQAEILDVKTTSSLGRFEWLEKQREIGTKVLIMNQTLVQVGLDLLEYPSLNFWQLNDDINVVRQASRRAWRIGQPRECKVRYYVSADTQQMKQFQRLMSRRISALLVEGRIERSDRIAQYAQESASGLTRELASSLSAAELTETWKSAAERDMDMNLTIVSETDYKQSISEAFERLTAETKRLCGYVEKDEIDQVISFTAEETQSTKSHPSSLTSPQTKHLYGELDLFSFNYEIEIVKTKKRGSNEIISKEQIAFNF
ncbi:formiminotetrahydrofolate cyclodeaminase [Paenibacillus sp. PastF-3]|uniref:hypothetical protein n=1 Tax=Paenibacillus sp. PastF-3 TaxID=2940626 RepID=UPI002473BCC7|nr:hypothetical protein [Paenibacillus sp. PastF-3]MDH6372837.1 formiminotetrahydrofolate cyclodeaminase [Paenibacillus sp. PastF-3]